MLYSKYPPDLVRKALDLQSNLDFLLRQDILDSAVHDATVWLPSLGQEIGLPSLVSQGPTIEWKQFLSILYHCSLMAAPETDDIYQDKAHRWHSMLSAMAETAFPFLYDTLPERQFMKLAQQEIVTPAIKEFSSYLPWREVPSWRWGHYASMFLNIPESHGEFWSISEKTTRWTTAHMASLCGRTFRTPHYIYQRCVSLPRGIILESSPRRKWKYSSKRLSVASVYYLSGYVFPKIDAYMKAPFDSTKTTVIEAILSKGTKHQDPSWLAAALKNLYVLYGKLPLEKIGRLAVLLYRRLQSLFYSEQLLRNALFEMRKLFSNHAGGKASDTVFHVFTDMVPEYSYWFVAT
ncbi:MAG: hypothetical protein WCR88_05375 [Aminobacterium sp.]